MTVCTQPLPSGTQLKGKKYTIEKMIGKGGFGFVYLARDQKGAPYAIKQCNDSASKATLAFGQEITVQRMVEHPTVPQIYEEFLQKLPGAQGPTDPDYAFVAMEFVDGEELEKLLATRLNAGQGPFAEADVLVWAEQLLVALASMHGKNVIHRDIKPANIMLLKDGRTIKLLDVGIAKVGSVGTYTQPGSLGYSPGYSPVEQYMQAGQTGPYSDVYAVGATLYTLLTGQEPKDSVTISNTPTLLIPPRRLAPTLSARTEQVILRAMETKVAQRYATANEMLAALTGKPGAGQTAGQTAGQATRTCPQCGAPMRPQARHCPQCGASVPLSGSAAGVSAAPQPALSVLPLRVDFGEQRYSPTQPPTQLLVLRNGSSSMIQARVQANAPWLEVAPQAFALAAQQSAHVSLALRVERMGEGSHQAALTIEGGAPTPVQVAITAGLQPGVVLDGRDVADAAGLIEWCDRNWAKAIGLLRSGELERMACFVPPPRTTARRTQWDACVAQLRAQANSAKADDLALEAALRALGAKPPAYAHNWAEVERALGFGLWPRRGARRAQRRAPQSVHLRLRNEGPRGYLFGRVTARVGWISVPQPTFGCAPRQHCDIELIADARSGAPLRGFAPRLLTLTIE